MQRFVSGMHLDAVLRISLQVCIRLQRGGWDVSFLPPSSSSWPGTGKTLTSSWKTLVLVESGSQLKFWRQPFK